MAFSRSQKQKDDPPKQQKKSSSSSSSSFKIELNRSFFLEFGQFLCRRIAISDFLDTSPLYPNERARLCWENYSVTAIFQGGIFKTFVFKDHSWSNIYIHSQDVIKLPYNYSDENIVHLILALGDYVTLFDQPLNHPLPLWLLMSYENLIAAFFSEAAPSLSKSSSTTTTISFETCVNYITRHTAFAYVSDTHFSYHNIPIPFMDSLKSNNAKLHWLHIMTLGGTFDNYVTTPDTFERDIQQCIRASIQKSYIINIIFIYNNPLPTTTLDHIDISKLPWRTCFEPNFFIGNSDSAKSLSVLGKSPKALDLHLYITLTPGSSHDLFILFSSNKQPPISPLLARKRLKRPTLMPICTPDLFRSRYVVSYRRDTAVAYPISLQIHGKHFFVSSASLLSAPKTEEFRKNPLYLDALCPVQGDLFWKQVGVCSVYNTLGQLTRIPKWLSFISFQSLPN